MEVRVDASTGDIIATLSEAEAEAADDDADDADEADDSDDDDGEADDEDDDDDEIDDDAVVDCTGGISATEALQIAEAEVSGTGVELDLDPEDCEFEVIIRTATGLIAVDVAPDGSVADVGDEADDADDDESDDGDEDEGEDAD